MDDTFVTIDGGDLLELQQAAEAWSGALRKRVVGSQTTHSDEVADRIDQAIHRTREAAHRGIEWKREWNPDGIPPIFDVFSIVRSAADELTGPDYINMGTDLVVQVAQNLKDIGDYDEPLILLIRAKLDGTITPENHTLLTYMAGREV